MAPLDTAGTGPTAPDVHLEQRRHRPRFGHLGLKLLGDALQLGRPAAARAHQRRRDVEHPVGVDRGHAMAVAAWPLPFLRPGRTGSRTDRPWRTAPTGACRHVEPPPAAGAARRSGRPGPSALPAVPRPRPPTPRSSAGPTGLRRGMIGGRLRRADSPCYTTRRLRWWTPLSKYTPSWSSGSATRRGAISCRFFRKSSGTTLTLRLQVLVLTGQTKGKPL